jgi:hypothetical protein
MFMMLCSRHLAQRSFAHHICPQAGILHEGFQPSSSFFRVSVQHQEDGLFLTQRQFALDILEHTGMVDCKPISTPVDTQAKVSATSKHPVADLTQFRSLIGALQYLMFIHPDIAYAVQQIYLHMHDLREPYLIAMKHVLRYL